jgi:hypothetical protein
MGVIIGIIVWSVSRACDGSFAARDGQRTKIMSLGPSLWLLAHFDLTIRLQICRNNPYFTVGIAAIHAEV